MNIGDVATLIGAITGFLAFMWAIATYVIGIVKGEPKTKADTYKALSESIEILNKTVTTQAQTLDRLGDEISERDTIISNITKQLTVVELERNDLKSRIKLLEEEFLIRKRESEELLNRLRKVESERDKLQKRVELLELENKRLENSIGKNKF